MYHLTNTIYFKIELQKLHCPYVESTNILLDVGEFMKDIYINGEATSCLKHNIVHKDVPYWAEVDYQ